MKNNWKQMEKNDIRDTDREEYAARTARRSMGRKKKKGRKLRNALIMLVYVTVLVAVMYGAAVIFTQVNDKEGEVPEGVTQVVSMLEGGNSEVISYSQQELDDMLAEVTEAANLRVEQAYQEKEAEILGAIRTSLSDGDTVLEALRPLYPDELVLASSGRYHFVPIREDLKHNALVQEKLQILEDGEFQYLEDGEVVSHKGIDVSKHQGAIDWEKVAADGVEFAFIRSAVRGYGSEGKLVEDDYFERNIKGATDAGVKVGVYIFSQAVTEEEILAEADMILKQVAPYTLDCPIVIDVEKIAGADGRMNRLTVEERTNLVLLFCQTIENAGYKPMIYHNMEMGVLMLDLEAFEDYDKWFASYSEILYYPYAYDIWQYSAKGSVDGIKTDVDLNISFAPFWED